MPEDAASPPTLLIADDEPQLLRLLVRVFERAGFRVLPAADGALAIAIFEEHAREVCAAVLDVLIPPGGVAEILDALHATRPGLGVVLTSGDEIGSDLRSRLDACRGRFLRKPFSLEALVAAVGEVGAEGAA